MSATVGKDVYGSCVCCHKSMVTTRVVDTSDGLKEKVWLLPEYDEVQFELDDGSAMRAVICKDCKDSLEEKDYKIIMKTIFNGWKQESEDLVKAGKWTDKEKDDYLKRYGKRKIHKRIFKKNEKLKKIKKETEKEE